MPARSCSSSFLPVGFRAADLPVTGEDLDGPQVVTRFQLLSNDALPDA